MINTSLLNIPDVVKIGLMALAFFFLAKWALGAIGVSYQPPI